MTTGWVPAAAGGAFGDGEIADVELADVERADVDAENIDAEVVDAEVVVEEIDDATIDLTNVDIDSAPSQGALPLNIETGDPRVDAAVASLRELDRLPVSEHADVFTQVHRDLQDALLTLDQS